MLHAVLGPAAPRHPAVFVTFVIEEDQSRVALPVRQNLFAVNHRHRLSRGVGDHQPCAAVFVDDVDAFDVDLAKLLACGGRLQKRSARKEQDREGAPDGVRLQKPQVAAECSHVCLSAGSGPAVPGGDGYSCSTV